MVEEKALSRREQLGMGYFQQEGGAELHSVDARPPLLVLAQSQNQDKYPDTGKIYRIDTMESFDSLRVIPLHIQRMRSKLPAGEFSRDRRPECMSANGDVPVMYMPFSDDLSLPYSLPGDQLEKLFGVQSPNQVKCMECPYFARDPFRVDPNSGMCMPEYLCVLMDAETYEGYIFTARRTNARAGRIMGNALVYRKKVVTITPEKVSGDRGTYYRLKYVPDSEEAPEDVQAIVQGLLDDYTVEEALYSSFEPQEQPQGATFNEDGEELSS